ncbi:solute carrier family 12 member 5-like isoform X1 [Lates japonicus]|uniref:Solute carrier family 12 member 5-like isoform X1 n=1 Tax=Lates japonicus TaxID=270547 RepID=A0AAD3N1D3_LATJO|nr:solute carrier family 12 member 5-like isoform X1 [Lates japonicus]
MSQRFTVSKSDGDRRPSDIQGEVNQLFEGDEPPTSSGAEREDAAGAEVVVVLKVDMSSPLLDIIPACAEVH